MESRTLPWHAVIVVALVGGGLAAQASATVIDTLTDWNNVYNVNSFGEGTTPTYGQTVMVPADNILDSFTFKLLQGGGDPTTIRFFVMAWDGGKVTGPVLFSTGPITLIQNTQFYQDYFIDAGRLSLVSGNQYALFFTSFLDYDGVNDASSAAARHYSEDPYPGGRFILNNVASSLTGLGSGGWQLDFLGMGDLAFRAEFSSLPIGDYNQNGVVDAADYVVWRKGLGTTYTQSDYDVWRAHFGQTAGSGAALPSAASLSAAVPEPSTLILMILAAVGWCLRRRRAV